MNKPALKKISDYAFIAGLICEIAVMPSGYIDIYLWQKYIILLGMAAFALSLLLSMDIKKDWKLFIPVFGFGLLCYYFQNSALVLRLGLLIMAGRTQERDKVIKFFFYGTAAWMLILLLLSFTGTVSLYSVQAFRHSADEMRFSFGFCHPNGFAFFWIKMVIMGLYLYGRKMKLWVRGLVFIAGIIPLVMAMTKAGMAFYVLFSVMSLYLACDKKEERSVKVMFFGGGTLMILELLMIFTLGILPYPQEHVGDVRNLWDLMNEVTTGRLQKARDVLMETAPTLFGTQGADAVNEIGMVDSLYREGIIFVIIYVVLLLWLFYRLYKKNDRYGMFLLLCFTFYTIAESYLPYANKNAVWLLFIALGESS